MLSRWQFCITPICLRVLGVSALDDIQGALNAVRSAAAEADWQTRLDALVLLLAASEDIVRRARQLTAPKQRTRTVTVPRVKTVKRYVAAQPPMQSPAKPPSLTAVRPKPPLPAQQSTRKPQ
jgi:hypothetical protein